MSEQLSALQTQQPSQNPIRCFKCGKLGHISCQCRSWPQIECYSCGGWGHYVRDCWNQGKVRGSAQNRWTGGTPVLRRCSHNRILTDTCIHHAHIYSSLSPWINQQLPRSHFAGLTLSYVVETSVTDLQPLHGVQLVNADGRLIFPSGTLAMSVNLGNLQAEHTFMVLDNLSTPVILGSDFLMKHNVTI